MGKLETLNLVLTQLLISCMTWAAHLITLDLQFCFFISQMRGLDGK